jgi:hypothetical protein
MKRNATAGKKGCLALLALAGIMAANADVIHSTYNPGDPLLTGLYVYRSYDLDSDTYSGNQIAVKFMPEQNYTLTTATISLQRLVGASSSFRLSLRSDLAGDPGAILTTFAGPGPIATAGPAAYNFTANVPVWAGQTYWLMATPNLTADSLFVWSRVSGNPDEKSSGMNESGGWDPWSSLIGSSQLAYVVSGNPVPEPGGYALFIAAGTLLLILRFRRS